MISFLIKKIIGLAICLAVLLVGYNYFWGNQEEQQSSQNIITEVKTLTGEVVDLLKVEQEKYENGKFDTALAKVKSTFTMIREKAMAMGEDGHEAIDKLDDLEHQGHNLKKKLSALDGDNDPTVQDDDRDQQAEVIRKKILKLNNDAHQLSQTLDDSSRS